MKRQTGKVNKTRKKYIYLFTKMTFIFIRPILKLFYTPTYNILKIKYYRYYMNSKWSFEATEINLYKKKRKKKKINFLIAFLFIISKSTVLYSLLL